MKKKKKAAPNEWRIREVDNSDRCWWWLASLFMAAILAVIVVSCTEEPVQPGAEEEGLPATIRLEVMPDAATQAQTRVDENAINNLHVLLYNSSGELVAKNYTTGSTVTLKTRSGSGYKIYAIANTGNSTLFDGAVASTETKLQAMNTSALSSWDGLTTASHLVMMGSKTGVVISAGSSTLSGGISVVRLAAKVTLKIGVKSGSGITITNYQVFSLPKQSRYVPGTTDGATSWINGALTTVNGTSVDKTFFMYENRRGVVSSITAQKDKVASKAPGYATYVVINGKTGYYNSTWRVYLGKNNTTNFNMERNVNYNFAIILSRNAVDLRVDIDDIYPSTDETQTSNCYILSPGRALTIPVLRANESPFQIGTSPMVGGKCIQLQADTPWTAEVVWQSSPDLVGVSAAIGKGPAGRFKVTTTDQTTQGNALVAIRSGENILWSWHIWIVNATEKAKILAGTGDSNFWMDRNLGALTCTPGDAKTLGFFYQWGRKDPFPVSASVSANVEPTLYNGKNEPYTISEKIVNETSPTLSYSIRHPENLIASYYIDKPYWGGSDATTPQGKMLKTVYDPCPLGWRVSSVDDIIGDGAITSWDQAHFGLNFIINSHNYGNWYPANSRRVSGTLSNVGGEGCYWFAAPDARNGGSVLHLTPSAYKLYISSLPASSSDSFSVRCSRE